MDSSKYLEKCLEKSPDFSRGRKPRWSNQWFPFFSVSGHQGQRLRNRNKNQWGPKNHFISVSAKFDGFILLMRPCVEKRIWPISLYKTGQRDVIAMKFKLDVSCYLPNVDIRFQLHISNLVKKKLKTLSAGGERCWDTPSGCLWPPGGPNVPNHDEKQYGSRHLLYKCVYQIWRPYIIFEALNEGNWLWSTFGCKVGESDTIVMKL